MKQFLVLLAFIVVALIIFTLIAGNDGSLMAVSKDFFTKTIGESNKIADLFNIAR